VQLPFLLSAAFTRNKPTTKEKHWFSAGKLPVFAGHHFPEPGGSIVQAKFFSAVL
jgi:hypothetical protein